MVNELCRLILKGVSDSILDSKIIQFHRDDKFRENIEIKENYDDLLSNISDIESNSELSLDEKVALITPIDKEVNKLLLDNPWLKSDPFSYPEFTMTSDEILDFKKSNYEVFRASAYDSVPIGKLIEDNNFDSFRANVRIRFPKS